MKGRHPGRAVEVWFQDQARIGQQGTLTRVWADKGSRPTALRQTEYHWLYLFAAVNPLTGDSSALIAPTVHTGLMNAHLRMISQQVGPQRHVVLVLDNAGWHVAHALRVPDNLTLLFLPPYSPELNPVERVWDWLRSHHLSNRVFADYDDLFDQTRDSWNRLDQARLRSITATDWLTRIGEG